MEKHSKQNKGVAKTKPVSCKFSMVVTGKHKNGYDYDADSAVAMVTELSEANVFDKLSVMVNVANSVVTKRDDAKGSRPVARITGYDTQNGELDLLFYGKNTELVDTLSDMVVVPRVRTNRESKVITILFFELVNAMEA